MKKNRVSTIIIVVLIVALAVSVWQNINNSRERVHARQYLLNAVFHNLTNASSELDKLISFIENNDVNDASKRDTILNISDYLAKADTVLTQYQYSTSTGLNYGGQSTFGFISYTLCYGQGALGDLSWDGILRDDTISENEFVYLTTLRDDISLVIISMTSADNQFNENKSLTISQLNNILWDFFDKWTYHNENSPYFLLESE